MFFDKLPEFHTGSELLHWHNYHFLPVFCTILFLQSSVVCGKGASLSRAPLYWHLHSAISFAGISYSYESYNGLYMWCFSMNYGCGCHLLQSWGLVLAFSWGWPCVSHLTAPRFGVWCQQTCQQPMCPPLSTPESMRATPKQRTPRQGKVRTQIESCTPRLECMHAFNFVVDVTELLIAFSILTT